MGRLRKDQVGTAALEALLSITLMLGAFYTMWGVALVVYNQSRLTTATAFAAHSAITVFERQAGYIVSGEEETRLKYICDASQVAAQVGAVVFKENVRGLARDQFSGAAPDISEDTPEAVECPEDQVPSISYTPQPGDPKMDYACYSINPDDPTDMIDADCWGSDVRVLRLNMTAPESISSFWLLAPLSGDYEQNLANLTAASSAMIYFPERGEPESLDEVIE